MNYEPSTWAGIANAVAAWIALVLSLFNIRSSRRALQLVEQREERRRPLLVPYLHDGYVRIGSEGRNRVYAFLLSVSNRSDAGNTVARMDLRLTYTTRAGLQMTVKVESQPEFGKAFLDGVGTPLPTPARLDAHQTIQGWCFFRVDEAILEGATIEGHAVVLIDSHGIDAVVEPIVVRAYGDESEIPPRTNIPPQRT